MWQVVDNNDKYLIILLVMNADARTDVAVVTTEQVVIELDRRTTTATYRAGDTLLETARSAGLSPPSSCETGSCGTCMARITEGCARMNNNDALEDDEVAEGWVLTCQALPTSCTVRVVYE
jgi:ferredoxin